MPRSVPIDFTRDGRLPLVIGGSHDPVSARVIEMFDAFGALYVTGFGLAASRLGLPDMGFMDRGDFIEGLERIRRVTRLPMIVDAEDGYGNGVQVLWTFRELARIGVSAAHIEDLRDPLKYRDDVAATDSGAGISARATAEDGTLHSVAAMEATIGAALEGSDGRVEVIARCDGQRFGVDRVIERLTAYLEAGATVAMVAEPYSLADLQRIASGIPGPLLCCVGVRQDHPAHAHSLAELHDAGVSGAIFTATTFFASVRAMLEAAALVAGQRSLSIPQMQAHLAPFEDVNGLLGAPDWYRTSERLSSGSDI